MDEDPTSAPGPPHRGTVVVAGASAGGVEALLRLIGSLPESFPHAVLVVLHISPSGTSVLPAILARAGKVPVASPVDGEAVRPGQVYVAPPDNHLVLEDGRLRLSQAPRENGHRPAIDPTMRSAAAAYGSGAVGIVLSGARDDGTAGLLAIKAGGGIAIVQDPEEAVYDSMPRSAIAHAQPDAILPLDAMGAWILQHIQEPMTRSGSSGPDDAQGSGTRYTCPDCGGVLFERHEGPLERSGRSVGHVFSIESLSGARAEELESSLWAAVRSLEDRAALLQRMSWRADGSGHRRSARTFQRQAHEALGRAGTIRDVIVRATAVDTASLHAEL